ncbi:unnamed protein product, partial [Nippostrongylus brasiliensis]|uniref:SCP domain-containing protein n=1 Tax=Nippostrongylus brasiliensis TaxID=27835 RepID=A0A0N4XP50_NIPBR
MYGLVGNWFDTVDVISDLVYDGEPEIRDFANMAKWNATEYACTFGSYNKGNDVLLICAYNVKGAVVGETIFEEARNGKYACDEGTQCGTDGKCDGWLCNVPVSNPDTVLPIYTPALLCNDLPFMSQFARYYALNQHNFYRRFVASGWAENKLTRFTPRAAKMEALSYDCSLEEAASEDVRKCERRADDTENNSDTGRNVQIINDVNMT